MNQIVAPEKIIFTRKYQPIWHKLKTEKLCRITAPKILHRRIIRAVLKEKYEDLGWKVEMNERGKKGKIEYTQSNNILQFRLIETFGIEDL